jgi:hypothetical protein
MMEAIKMDLLDQFSYKQLNASSGNFKNGNSIEGFNRFNRAYPTHQNKVYEQICIDKEMPWDNSEYGRRAFNNTDGFSSAMQEKAEAIDLYLESSEGRRKLTQEDQNVRMAAGNDSSYEWTHRNGKWNHHPKGRPPIINPDKIWCPSTKEEWQGVGFVTGACAAVGAAAFAIYKIFEAVKGTVG